MQKEKNIFLSESSYVNKKIAYLYETQKINSRDVIPNSIVVSLTAPGRDRFWNSFKHEDKVIKP